LPRLCGDTDQRECVAQLSVSKCSWRLCFGVATVRNHTTVAQKQSQMFLALEFWSVSWSESYNCLLFHNHPKNLPKTVPSISVHACAATRVSVNVF
jgi:hypothetical protein